MRIMSYGCYYIIDMHVYSQYYLSSMLRMWSVGYAAFDNFLPITDTYQFSIVKI